MSEEEPGDIEYYAQAISRLKGISAEQAIVDALRSYYGELTADSMRRKMRAMEELNRKDKELD